MSSENRIVTKPFVGIDTAGQLVRMQAGATLIAPETPGHGSTMLEVLCTRCGKAVKVFSGDLDCATVPVSPNVHLPRKPIALRSL